MFVAEVQGGLGQQVGAAGNAHAATVAAGFDAQKNRKLSLHVSKLAEEKLKSKHFCKRTGNEVLGMRVDYSELFDQTNFVYGADLV